MWINILIIILIALLIIFVILFLIGHYIFRLVFDRNKIFKTNNENGNPLMSPTEKELQLFNQEGKDNFQNLKFETLTIKSFDNLTLYANYLKGEDDSVTIIMVHGYRSSPIGDFVRSSEIYIKKKYSILFTENRAHGRSEGKYIGMGELDSLDVSLWVKKIKEMNPNTNIYLHGNSMGGATVTHCANLNLDIKGIIADCGFTSILDITRYLIKDVIHVPYFPLGELARLNAYIFAKIPFNRTHSFKCVENSNVPIVFISGTEDNFVPKEMSIQSYEHCSNKKYLLLVEGAGHVASYMKDKKGYERIVNELINDTLNK